MNRVTHPFFPVFRRAAALMIALCFLEAACAGHASANDKAVHINRVVIQAEGEKADVCLELDHEFTGPASATAEATKAQLQVTLNGDVITLASKNLALAGNQLCLRNLDYRTQYHLRIDQMVGTDGFYLKSGEKLTIDVPPRTPALSFPQTLRANGTIDWGDDIILRSVNTHHLVLELYAITDTAAMAEAWRQRLQTTLAPSESATFARNHGTLVKKWDMATESRPDAVTTTPLPLNSIAPDAPSGLYLLAVTAPDDKLHVTDLTPGAAAWLLRGGLTLKTMRDGALIAIIADKTKGGSVAAQVKTAVIDQDGHDLASGETDAAGIALLHLPRDKATEPVMIVGRSAAGETAFAAPAPDSLDALKPPAIDARIKLHQSFYRPGDVVHIDTTALDLHGQPVAFKDSVIQILNADGSVYAAAPVKAADPATGKTGHGEASLIAPALSGTWKLVWLIPSQAPMTESVLRVTHHPDAPVFTATAEQSQLPEDGKIVLHVRSLRYDGSAAPYVAGVVHNGWQATRHIFSGWDNVAFGSGAADEGAAQGDATTIARFVTDARGQATLYLKLNPPRDLPTPSAARLLVDGSEEAASASDIAASPPVILPLKPHERLVGLRASQPAAHFPENGTARFDVVVLDADGKKQAADDLSYRIYEKGRSFAWRQAEGRWDYTLQNQVRLIGSHALNVPPNGVARIEWPVTSGTYRVDILDGDDQIVASLPFSAGWKNTAGPQKVAGNLDLHIETPTKAGDPYKILFDLDKPALITALISDDQLRQIIHTQKPAGRNEITLAPVADWGQSIAIHIDAIALGDDIRNSATQTGQIVLNTRTPEKIAPPAPALFTASPVVENQTIPDTHVAHETTLKPQQSWTYGGNAAHATAVILESGTSLGQAPALLTSFLRQPVDDTAEVIDDIQTLRDWRTTIVATGMMADGDWQRRLDRDVERLLTRQGQDGSFDHDVLLTAKAVSALSGLRQPAALDGHDRAVALLQQRLGDSWVDDRDRPVRAAIYAALTQDQPAATRIDTAGLRYFSDNSQDKALPPLAAAQLAQAFASLHDDEHAQSWLQKAACAAADRMARAACMPFLARNPLVAAADIEASLAAIETDHAQDHAFIAPILAARAALAERSGLDIRIAGVAGKNASPTIKNNAQQPMILTVILLTPHKTDELRNLEQRFYRMDGSEVSPTEFQSGHDYVMAVSSSDGRGSASTLALSGGGLLAPVSCAIAIPDSGDFMGWAATRLGNASGPEVDRCEWLRDDVHIRLKPQKQPWTVISLWRAIGKGRGLLPPVVLRDNEHPAAQQTASQKIAVF